LDDLQLQVGIVKNNEQKTKAVVAPGFNKNSQKALSKNCLEEIDISPLIETE